MAMLKNDTAMHGILKQTVCMGYYPTPTWIVRFEPATKPDGTDAQDMKGAIIPLEWPQHGELPLQPVRNIMLSEKSFPGVAMYALTTHAPSQHNTHC